MFVYSLSAEHKTRVSINGTGLSYRSCACAFARMLTEPSPHFKLSHVTYILLLCDLWQRWAVGRLFARVQTPPSLSVALGGSFSRHIFPTETPIITFLLKEDMSRESLMISGLVL